MGKYIHIPKEVLFDEYVINNKNMNEIAKQIGCSNVSIKTKLSQYGIPVRKIDDTLDKTITKEYLEQEYLCNNKSISSIAKELSISETPIYKRLRLFKIPIRLRERHPIFIKVSDIPKNVLFEEYVDKKRALSSLVNEFKFDIVTIKNRLLEVGIIPRNLKESVLPNGAYISDTEKWCPVCKTMKPLSNFGTDKKGTFGIHGVCDSCVLKNRQSRYEHNHLIRLKNKSNLVMHFGNKCCICGAENLPIACYSFHHTDPSKKDHHIKMANFKDKRKLKELKEKCVLICYNCHSALHHGKQTATEIVVLDANRMDSTKDRKLRKSKLLLELGNSCAICGKVDLPICCYAFHHQDPNNKEINVSTANYTVASIIEIKKGCLLVCHNCHYIIHNGKQTAIEILSIVG